MPAYHQMGHDSENLLFEPELGGYAGAILSPVNYNPEKTARQVARCREALGEDFDLVFDPQLYRPNTDRGKIEEWDYFPSDVDTAGLSDMAWWNALVAALRRDMEVLRPDAVCSPVQIPRTFNDGYYQRCVEVAGILTEALPEGIRTVQTALVQVADLTTVGRVMAIASILTRGSIEEVYLVAVTDREPRREHRDTEGLKGLMRLISALEGAGARVTVGFSSSDLLLWKEAGASSCATGKFFNLRRFTSSRWEEPGDGGGGQLAYWFEESLLGFLRAPDLIRIRRQGLLSEASERNPFLEPVTEAIETETAWVGLGWRQFLWWFADAEARIESGRLDVRAALRTAEQNWLALEDADVLMEEPRNDGSWLRPWRRATAEYSP